jgi:hypothetical protein
VKHFASSAFWKAYEALPPLIREIADKNYTLLKENPQHPSLHFKKVGRLWSVRIGLRHRALGTDVDGGILWFWVGSHANYDALIG